MFIPIFIPGNNGNNGKPDRKKSLILSLTLLIDFVFFFIMFILITFFDMKLFSWFYILCLIIGIGSPILSKYLVNKFKL